MEVIIKIKEVLKTEFAIKDKKGEELYEIINKNIKNDNTVVLDFSDIIASTTRFFNLSLGKLYGEYNFEIVDNIKVENANKVVYNQYEVAKNGAKKYYKNKRL